MKRTSRVLSAALTAIFCIGLLTGLPPSAKAADDYPSEYKSAEHSTVVDRWRFFNRECTSFVAWCLESRNGVVGFNNRYGGVLWGNAKDWAGGARALGIVVDMNPAVGSVAWTDDGIYGHVAWVSAVSGDNITIEDYNSWGYSGAYNVRTVHKSTFRGFIHIKDMIAVPVPSNPTMSLDRGNSPVYTVGETVAFTYSANDARDYTIGIDRNGERILTQGVPAGGFLYKPAQAGTYSAYVTCYNAVGGIDSPKVHFMVVNPAQTYEKVTWSVSGHQYQVIDEALTWTQAQQKAASLGGTLATVTSAAEWEYIVGLLKPTHRLNYWLGGTDSANEGTWAWVTGELWTYSAWNSGEPNGGTAENRLHFFKNADGGAVWNDAGNEENADFGYIVEWEPAVYRVSGTVTSYNPGSATKVTLWRDDGTKNSYNMAIDGVGKRTSPFTFRNVTPGTYTLTVEKDAHTKYTIKDFTVGGDILFDDLTLPCGDINGDNLINQADLNVLWLPGNYNKSAEAAANPLCDLDGDGLINQADLNILWLPGNYNKGGVTVG